MSRWILVFVALAAIACHSNGQMEEEEKPDMSKWDKDTLFKGFVRSLAKNKEIYDKWLEAIYNNYAQKISFQKNDMNRICMNTLATDTDSRYNETMSLFIERNQKYWEYARKTALAAENTVMDLMKLDQLLITLLYNQHVDYQIGVKDFVYEDRVDYRNCMIRRM